MKSVLFVIGSLQSGGAERVAARLCSYWSNSGYEITLATGVSKDSDFYDLDRKVERKSLGFNYNVSGLINKLSEQFTRFFKIESMLKSGNYDVVILSATDISIRFMLNLLISSKKVIICEHNNYYAVKSKFKKFARNILFKRADFLFLLTERDKETYLNKGFNADKLHVMKNPLGLPLPTYMEKEPTKKLLAVGRLTKQKSFSRLLRIVSTLDDSFNLTIVGDGEEKEELVSLCDELDLNNKVTFLGNQKDMDKVYRNHDVLLMTSIYEGLPMVIGEANAYGLPVIAFDCPTGPRELIEHNFNGYLIDDGDSEGFSRSIECLFKTPELYKTMSENAHFHAKKQSIEEVAESWKLFLE
ncbi:glycosyltransferase family 4 protein [Pseudoalteromonas sp. T1lg122]|uniref:glycosyltransferase family 4 protein n=1 Tax=Pseudoalteromonas sp. T1lg122 TaxID=2077094 RepID=UPI000CF6A00A|nr:glycosyltransferase family 4 protein [Pseudoalteromonas sp. T1lg122]